MAFMKRNSGNCDVSGGREAAYATLCGKNVLELRAQANAHGVEWHHASGHSDGRQIISFFPENAEQERAVDRLAALVAKEKEKERKERENLKKAGLPTSKAALWRHLEANGFKDCGFGCVEYKNGKYGPFVPGFGEPDGVYFFDSEEIAEIARQKLKI